MNEQPSLPLVVTARSRVRIVARSRVRVQPVEPSIQTLPKTVDNRASDDGFSVLTDFLLKPAREAVERVKSGFHEGQIELLPGGYRRYVRDESLSFEQFRLDPLCNVSQTGYEYTEREMQSAWGVVIYWRDKRAGK